MAYRGQGFNLSLRRNEENLNDPQVEFCDGVPGGRKIYTWPLRPVT
ncbi:hypothetical protein AG1IA_06784 [Rhizoctonia solani AG-1 IA]|uniref:Uncharacterized protein n=1 Tax=Thanatephorus cucumeris (strain AG1-IA) TaxID=983506 RepID=L8WR04_THACA|nr:hypothetical protein AG1IA_06784 [Rhizoctonia solani AG-1 IA]